MVTPTKRAERKQRISPIKQSNPKSLIMGMEDVSREIKPMEVMIRAMITGLVTCLTVSTTAFCGWPVRVNSSFIRFWNWMA
ncbi:MAG: hypothetical protein A4E43_00037 [Methanosaeta sp. PtaB.Bin005]|nr:MAG: hypothetical protein A4E43_00037 [Methanosaeta sp. PtaB.Bin005]